MNKTGKYGLMFAGLLCTALLIGCGTGDRVADEVGKANEHNVSKVASCYNLFLLKNGFKGPKDKAELIKMIQDPSVAKNMELIGVDTSDPEAIFIGDRDDEEIKVRWGVKGSALGTNEPISFESTGVKGVRLVVYATGVINEVEDDQTYNDMFEGKYQPPATRDDTPKFDNAGNPI